MYDMKHIAGTIISAFVGLALGTLLAHHSPKTESRFDRSIPTIVYDQKNNTIQVKWPAEMGIDIEVPPADGAIEGDFVEYPHGKYKFYYKMPLF